MEEYSTSSSMDTASSIVVRNTGSLLKVGNFVKNSMLSFGNKTNRIYIADGGRISCPRVHLSPFNGTSFISIHGYQAGRGIPQWVRKCLHSRLWWNDKLTGETQPHSVSRKAIFAPSLVHDSSRPSFMVYPRRPVSSSYQ